MMDEGVDNLKQIRYCYLLPITSLQGTIYQLQRTDAGSDGMGAIPFNF